MELRRCPCRSGRRYQRCCQRFHAGAPAPTPEHLMRSRFSAYALGLVDYILATTHPDGPHFKHDAAAWSAEVQAFSAGTRFRSLDILDTGSDGDTGFVDFRAGLEQGGRDASFRERSTFELREGRWLYRDGAPRSA